MAASGDGCGSDGSVSAGLNKGKSVAIDEAYVGLAELKEGLHVAVKMAASGDGCGSDGSVSAGLNKGKSVAIDEAYVGLAELKEGLHVAVKVMVCRKWDATNTFGKYLGTEYILSDSEGGVIQCSARANIAHRFVTKLHEGSVYSLKNFTVVPNKEKFRIRRTNPYTLALEGFTIVRKLACSAEAFTRFPFQLTALEDVEVNDSTFLIDVVGAVTGLGNIRTTRGGSELVDFQIVNEREAQVSVTLWAPLCHDLLKRKACSIDPYIVILPGMNVKAFRGEPFLSNTSATTLYDDPDIPQIAELVPLFRNCTIVNSPAQPLPSAVVTGGVYQLLKAGRAFLETQKKSCTFHCKVEIVNVQTKDGWFYYSCGIGGCKRRVSRSGTKFMCLKCNKVCEFPRISYRLHLVVADSSGTVPVTMFDEVATKLIGRTAADLLAEAENDCNEDVLPTPIVNLAKTTHTLEVKSHTYYNQGVYESFTVNSVVNIGADKLLPQKRAFDDMSTPRSTSTTNASLSGSSAGNGNDNELGENKISHIEVTSAETPEVHTMRK